MREYKSAVYLIMMKTRPIIITFCLKRLLFTEFGSLFLLEMATSTQIIKYVKINERITLLYTP